MTDNKIIKALESEIHLAEYAGDYCGHIELSLIKEALNLINRQKAEIERLKECPKCIYEYDGKTTEYCIQGPCSNFKTTEQVRTKAYKEFAVRLKCGVPQETGVIRCSDIDNLLKEVEGEE